MSKKTSDFPIKDLNFSADWSNNENDHLPQSGSQVNNFLNNSLRDVARACWFDPSSYALLFFRSDEDKQTYIDNPSSSEALVAYKQILSFTGTVRRVNIINETGITIINATTNQENVPIKFRYELVEKGVTESEWHLLEDSATIIVYADNGDGYYEIFRKTGVEHSDPSIELNVRPFLVSGTNKIRVTAIANDTESTTGNLTYNVTLAEMYVENFYGRSYWYRAIVEGMSSSLYQLGGFKIVGTLNKTIHFDIYKSDNLETKLLHLEKVLGNSQYINYEYSYNYSSGLRLNELSTGSYIAKVYLTSGNLSTIDNAIEYPFMYVRQEDALSAKLVTIADITPVVYNGESSVLCKFAAYDSGLSSAAPLRTVQQYKGSIPYGNIIEFDSTINTNASYTLECPIEIEDETTEIGYLSTEIIISLGESIVSGHNIVDNTTSYPPVSGFDFSMNPALRNNGETHPEYISNDVNGETCQTVDWTKMAFVDNIDGWTHDEDGRTCLRIPAGSKMSLPYSFFKFLNNSNQGRNTVEICYKITHVSDYSENCITIAQNPTSEGFTGLRIRPNSILVHSSTDTSSANDTNRGTNLSEDQIVNFMLSIEPNFVSGKNLVTGFIDGCKNFQFEFVGNFNFNANLIIGSDTADVYIYALRHYANSLRQDSAESNFVSTIKDRLEKVKQHERIESVIDTSHDISIQKVKENKFNYFVVEMKNGASIPSKKNGWEKSTLGQSTLEMHFGEHPTWDFKVEDVETGGQGTTSMNYWLWNLRFRLDKWPDGISIPPQYQDSQGKYNKKRPISYLDENGEWTSPVDSKTVWFDGGNVASEEQHPALKRITAKINFASSMQSHKIGATGAYNALHDAIDNGALMNEAQVAAQQTGTPIPLVAVYEYPAFGFSKVGDTYEFIGLFTIGPDKGDKPTFGYDNSDFESSLITLEGTDHTPRLALFNHPWDENVEYRASNECLNIVTGISEQDLEKAWEASNAGSYSTDKEADQQNIDTLLKSEFKPAYDSVYNNSTLIFPVALNNPTWGGQSASAVLANINADILNPDGTFWNSHYIDDQGHTMRFPNSAMEFWIEGEYVLYHYSPVTEQFVAGVNLVTQCGTPEGTTLDEKNEYFKNFRRNAFKSEAANYWDLDDSIFCMTFLLIFGATDNFAKNSYPYKFKSLASGGRWRWRQDDLDTIFDIDNNGGQTKPYYIEYSDTSTSGEIYFAGSSSIFWNLLFETFYEDYISDGQTRKGIRSMGAAILTAMQTLTGKSNIYQGMIAFFQTYFWDKAQDYFPISGYNVDGALKYEDAWINQDSPTVAPLTQALGNHSLAERRWIDYRALYVMSLFRVGPFAQYNDNSFGAISFRPVSLPALELTPSIWLYPAVIVGQGGNLGTSRVPEGETKVYTGISGDGQTVYVIQAADYLTDLGDLCKLILGTQDAGVLNIGAERLKSIKIGDSDSTEVTTNITTLNFTNAPALEEINAKNAPLANVLNLTNCPRIREVYAEGTQISSVSFKEGSKIEVLHLPDTISELILKKTKFLNDLTVDNDDWSGIVTLQMEECNAIGTMEALVKCYNATGSALEYIQLKWNTLDQITAPTIGMLANIASGKGASGESKDYDCDLEGQMKLDAPHYESDLQALQFQEVTPSTMVGYKEAVSTIFQHPLRLFYKYGDDYTYIPFADAEVKRVLLAASIGDGYGITKIVAAARTSIPSFNGNTLLKSFDELTEFSNVKSIPSQGFNGCTNLESINLEHITSFTNGRQHFYNCSKLAIDLNLPLLTGTLGTNADRGNFSKSGITKILNLGSITQTYDGGELENFPYMMGVFNGCFNLTEATLPSTLINIGSCTFYNCSKLQKVVNNSPAFRIGYSAFFGCTKLSQINLENVTEIQYTAFQDCGLLAIDLNLPNLTSLKTDRGGHFVRSGITKIISLGSITTTYAGGNNLAYPWSCGSFVNCKSLTEVRLPSTLISLGSSTFDGCSALNTVIVDATTPPTFGTNAFRSCPLNEGIYVPDASVDTYKAASGWSAFASKIKPISELPTE